MYSEINIRLFHLVIALCGCVLIGCHTDPLEEIISTAGPQVTSVTGAVERFHAQVIYVQINRDGQNRPRFTTYKHQVTPKVHFDPAEAVQFPVAVLALEKLYELGISSEDLHVRMRFDSARASQSRMLFDPTSPSGMPTPSHFIQQIGAFADDHAYNRLYEFLGQDDIRARLQRVHLSGTRIVERLGPQKHTAEDNRYTNPVSVYVHDTLVYQRDEIGGSVVSPGNGKRNHFPLADQVQFLLTLMLPESVHDSLEFCLSEQDYRLAYQALSGLPHERHIPYDTTEWFDGSRKFFIIGDSEAVMPAHVWIFNMSGYAGGQMTDCAYIVDFMHQIEFIIAATVNVSTPMTDPEALSVACNEIGRPFFTQLGKAVYAFELQRRRRFKPLLTDLQNTLIDPQY
jgi:hypothetical protein